MNESYEPVIGLEVHVQVNTKSKIFCGCSTEFGVRANLNTCEICQGYPGSLPVLNWEVVKKAMKAGLALGCRINEESKFDRKHYFYPDLPKGYQITQQHVPICEGGKLFLEGMGKEVRIRRLHMEEDAGKLIHGKGNESYVDFNRSGVPLLEIVTESDMRSGEEARVFLNDLKLILRYMDVSDCNMEEGSLRCDVNISLREYGKGYGERVEVKNLNSFRSVKRAIDFEVRRQGGILSGGGVVKKETRLYDMDRDETRGMRGKEGEEDYLYLPEPDLRVLILEGLDIQKVREGLGEFPMERLERFSREYGLSENVGKVLVSRCELADYYELVLSFYDGNPVKVANWVIGDVLRVFDGGNFGVSAKELGGLIRRIEEGVLSGKMGKLVFEEMLKGAETVEEVIERLGLNLMSDEGELVGIIEEVLVENEGVVESYRGGKEKAMGYLVGQVMRKTGGQAEPKKVNRMLKKKLS